MMAGVAEGGGRRLFRQDVRINERANSSIANFSVRTRVSGQSIIREIRDRPNRLALLRWSLRGYRLTRNDIEID